MIPFTINIPNETIDTILKKVSDYPWHEMPDDGGWEYGTNLDYMKEICAYWVDEYDWRKHETRMNRLSHFRAEAEGIDLHFIMEKGSGPDPIPLIISHGWPGSFVESLDIIECLAHPERFGGKKRGFI